MKRKRRHATDGVREAKVYKTVGIPDRRKVPKNAPIRRAKKWTVQWRTEVMPASSFLYFDRKRDAQAFADSVLRKRAPQEEILRRPPVRLLRLLQFLGVSNLTEEEIRLYAEATGQPAD